MRVLHACPGRGNRGGMADPLDTYRGKRDFGRTPEPAGDGRATRRRCAAFRRAAAPRRAGCTTTCASRSTACWSSWAVPKGPTLDPQRAAPGRARRGPPDRVPRLRGRHPAGRVRRRRRDRLGHRHLGAAPAPTTPRAAVGGRRAARRAARPASCAAGSCWSAATDGPATASEQWLLLHKRDEHAVEGWDPEDHPRSVLSGRTNDEVAADPRPALALGRCRRPRPSGPLVPDPLPDEAIDDARRRSARRAPGRCSAASCGSPTSTRCCSPAGRAAGHQARAAGATRRGSRPSSLPYLEGRALNLHRYPDGAEQGASGTSSVPDHAPEWLGALGQPGGRRGRDHDVPRRRRARRPGLGGQLRRAGVAPVDLADRRAAPTRRTPWSTSTRAPRRLGRPARARPAAPHGPRAPRRHRARQGHRAARHPDLGADRAGLHVRRHPRLGRAALPDRRRRSCPSW